MSTLINIDNSFESYQRLINFYQSNKNKSFSTVEVRLSQWFAANMSSALGGLLDLIGASLNDIDIKASSDIERILLKNDFLSYFGHKSIEDTYHTTIRFLKLKPTDGKFFKNYVINDLLEREELPMMSAMVKQKMAEIIYEIFVNAQIHSQTNYIYTCGQFFPNQNKIEFTITDTGIGFKNRINKRFNSNLSSIQAIKWATEDKNTTKEGIPGGIGLAILKEFITKNQGKMQIVSDDGFYQYEHGNEKLRMFTGSFPGTIVNLQFKTDDSLSYTLKEEISIEDIF